MPHRQEIRHVRIAVLIGAVAILSCFGLGYWAYGRGAIALQDVIAQSNLELARRMGTHAVGHHPPADLGHSSETLEELAHLWQETEPLYEGSYLCVIDRSGTILLHTADRNAVGRNVSGVEIHSRDGEPIGVGEMIERGDDWAGVNRNLRGVEQIVGYAYFPELDGSIVVHTPVDLVVGDLRASALPWGIGVTIIGGVLIPLLIVLLHRSYSSTHRSLIATESKRKELEELLRQTQKMEAVGRLAGGVAHDFNNLLTALFGNIDLARQDLGEAIDLISLRIRLDEIEHTADRASMLTRQLLAFSRKQDIELRTLDLNELVRRTHGMLDRLLGDHVRLEVQLGDDVPYVYADLGLLEQILLNLALNGRDSMPNGGTLRIETACVDLSASGLPGMAQGAHAELRVVDSGSGMSPDVVERIFDPFFTTKQVGEGTGLGLSTVYNIVQKLDGRIQVNSTVGVGTRMVLQFPASSGEIALDIVPPVAAVGHGETVLICEDDASVRRLTSDSLKAAGYSVLVASCGKEALQLARAAEPPVQLLVTDVMLPDLDGRQVAQTLKTENPDMPVLFISGFTGNSDPAHLVDWDPALLLNKPFKAATLLHRVGAALHQQAPS